MKKVYSLMLAVAATAMVASAATPAKQFQFNSGFSVNTVKTIKSVETAPVKVAEVQAKAEADAPASLLNQKFYISYTIKEYNKQTGKESIYDVTSPVTFNDEETEQGAKYYLMNGFLSNNYGSALTFPDLEVGYIPEEGLLVIFGDQPFVTYQSIDCAPYSGNDTDGYYNINLQFTYADGGFKMVSPVNIKFQDGSSKSVKITDVVLGTVENQQLSTLINLGGDWTFTPYDLGGENTFTATLTSGAKEFAGDVYCTLADGHLIMNGFAQGMVPTIDFTIDAATKTLSATNVMCGKQDFSQAGDGSFMLDTYLSKANLSAGEPVNATPMASAISATYEVEGNQTIITFPDWNVFTNNGQVEIPLYVPMSKTTVTLDGDLEQLIAGVNDITTAPAELDANAPVEYFNLQGVRVAEPAAGLYIRRQGNTVSKVVIR